MITEDVMRYATASVREFYKKLDLEVNDGLSTTNHTHTIDKSENTDIPL